MASFTLKIIIKATYGQRSGGGIGENSAITYHVESFIQFVFAEFLLIAVWTWFKSQDDFFSIYNNLPVRKFSIFQKVVGLENDSSNRKLVRLS